MFFKKNNKNDDTKKEERFHIQIRDEVTGEIICDARTDAIIGAYSCFKEGKTASLGYTHCSMEELLYTCAGVLQALRKIREGQNSEIGKMLFDMIFPGISDEKGDGTKGSGTVC